MEQLQEGGYFDSKTMILKPRLNRFNDLMHGISTHLYFLLFFIQTLSPQCSPGLPVIVEYLHNFSIASFLSSEDNIIRTTWEVGLLCWDLI